MKSILTLALLLTACQPRTDPHSAADPESSPTETPRAAEDMSSDEASATPAPGSPAAPASASTPASEPAPQVVLTPLVELLNAALTGRDLPQTPFALPGTRGEQIVRVQGAFPEGAMSASAALLKVDVTHEGCGDGGGLALGLLQTGDGRIFIVGLGDQFQAASGESRVGLENLSETAAAALSMLRSGDIESLRLTDAVCQQRFDSVERCHRIFRELPSDETFARYRAMLSGCQTEPVLTLAVVGLFLFDASGGELQALARFERRDEGLALTAPIVLAPGVE